MLRNAPHGASSGGGAPGLMSSREYAMRVALHDSDETNFPNLALMKLSAWHKAQGDEVSWFAPDKKLRYDRVYSSKVFTFTPEQILPSGAIKGGTGYGMYLNLPDEIEHICPDYQLYRHKLMLKGRVNKLFDCSMGFLTRGCPNDCPWCIVPKKEGGIRAHADIEEFCRHRHVILMDNNVLAHDHGIKQIEKISRLGLRVDFNQGLDARRIDFSIASRLAALSWFKPLRLACDRNEQMPVVEKTVRILRSAGVKPQRYFCYVLVTDVEEALERVKFLRSLNVDPFAQAYRSFTGTEIPTEKQRRFCRWVNHKALFKSISWEIYWEQERKKLEKRNRQSWLWL